MSVSEVESTWLNLHGLLGIASPITDEQHYVRLAEFAEQMAEQLPDEHQHPMWALVHLVADRLQEYEQRVHPWPELSANELLRYLMDEHGLTQKDLPELGTQSVVSEVLSGKRALNLRQVKALAARFHLPMEAFSA